MPAACAASIVALACASGIVSRMSPRLAPPMPSCVTSSEVAAIWRRTNGSMGPPSAGEPPAHAIQRLRAHVGSDLRQLLSVGLAAHGDRELAVGDDVAEAAGELFGDLLVRADHGEDAEHLVADVGRHALPVLRPGEHAQAPRQVAQAMVLD